MTINIIHRGNFTKYPENSIMAFKEGLANNNYQGIETDIQISSDNIFYCFHDDTLERMTDSNDIHIYDKSFFQIRQYNLKNKSGDVTKYKIPTLKSLLILNQFYKKILNLEIKINPMIYNPNKIIVDIKKEILKYGMENYVVISSFYYEYYFPCMKNNLKFGLLVSEDDLDILKNSLLPKIIIFDKNIDIKIIKKYSENGVLGIYTVNEQFNDPLFKIIIKDIE